VQWQISTFSGSISASQAMKPQWQPPSIFIVGLLKNALSSCTRRQPASEIRQPSWQRRGRAKGAAHAQAARQRSGTG
jgi:hypothetical protein